MGYVLVLGTCLVPPRRSAWLRGLVLGGALAYGSLLGTTRVIQGGHFLSDVLWSGSLMCFMVATLQASSSHAGTTRHRIAYHHPPTIAPHRVEGDIMSRIPHVSPPLARLTRRQFVRALGLSAIVSTVGVPRLSGPLIQSKSALLLDLTGALEAYGKPIQNGAILAAEHLNAAGGPLGRQLELVHRDSQTDPTAGIDAAKKLVELDKVVAIVGALSSGVTIPVATSVTIPGGIVQISPASTSPQITDLQDNGLAVSYLPLRRLTGQGEWPPRKNPGVSDCLHDLCQ